MLCDSGGHPGLTPLRAEEGGVQTHPALPALPAHRPAGADWSGERPQADHAQGSLQGEVPVSHALGERAPERIWAEQAQCLPQ